MKKQLQPGRIIGRVQADGGGNTMSMGELLTRTPQYLEHTCNQLRLHSALGYLPPNEFETQHQRAIPAVKS